MFPKLMEKESKLNELLLLTNATTLDLSGYGFTELDVPIIRGVLYRCPNLTKLNLDNNDFRSTGMASIINQIRLSNPKLSYLSIVDNNIDQSFVGTYLAPLIADSSIKRINIGARRIMGTSGYDHMYQLRGASYYHGTGNNGFYSGYNEVVMYDQDEIKKAIAIREKTGTPVELCYFTSTTRTIRPYPVISQEEILSVGGLEMLSRKYRSESRYIYNDDWYTKDMSIGLIPTDGNLMHKSEVKEETKSDYCPFSHIL